MTMDNRKYGCYGSCRGIASCVASLDNTCEQASPGVAPASRNLRPTEIVTSALVAPSLASRCLRVLRNHARAPPSQRLQRNTRRSGHASSRRGARRAAIPVTHRPRSLPYLALNYYHGNPSLQIIPDSLSEYIVGYIFRMDGEPLETV